MKEDIVFANDSLNKWCNTQGINYYEGSEALGNLFQYAVPKLKELGIMRIEFLQDLIIKDSWLVSVTNKPYTAGTNPALALFWVIWEVIKESERKVRG